MDLKTLQASLQRWPTLRAIWDTSFVTEAWQEEKLPLWLTQLREGLTDVNLLNELDRLESWLKRLSLIPGFDRLAPGIKSRGERTWSHAYLEVDVLQHWESATVLKEIQPLVPGYRTSADFLLCVQGKNIWGEVTQFEARRKARVAPGITLLLSPEEELRRYPHLCAS
jgi:hypothetical protein